MSLGDNHCVVCDNGTGFVKVGYAGENFPRSIFPSMVGRPILRAEEAVAEGLELKSIMCGDEASQVRNSLECSYPVENGIVKDWDDMELLWNYTFYEKLGIDPKDYKIMLTEPPMNPLANRKKLVTAMFELYGFGHCNVSIQAMLTLYAQGLLTGCVVDTGDGVTHVVPVFDGFVPQNLIRRLDVAGRHVTRYLIKLLLLRGYACNRTADFETVRQIKEKFCYVAHDINVERRLAQETTDDMMWRTVERKLRRAWGEDEEAEQKVRPAGSWAPARLRAHLPVFTAQAAQAAQIAQTAHCPGRPLPPQTTLVCPGPPSSAQSVQTAQDPQTKTTQTIQITSATHTTHSPQTARAPQPSTPPPMNPAAEPEAPDPPRFFFWA